MRRPSRGDRENQTLPGCRAVSKTDSTFVCRLEELGPGASRLCEVDGKPVVVFNVGGNFFATSELCPHRAGPLSEGSLSGFVIECPWHRARFDVRTGEVIFGPAKSGLKTYKVVADDDGLHVCYCDASSESN
jgi:nitrite reductase/ring-hydroxylating ferredoxin subunit